MRTLDGQIITTEFIKNYFPLKQNPDQPRSRLHTALMINAVLTNSYIEEGQ